MKSLLILDTMFSYGHKKFNYHYIEVMQKYCKLIIINNGEYYNELNLENIELYNLHDRCFKSNPIFVRRNMLKTFKYIKKSEVLKRSDAVLVMGYDTLIFPFFFLICKPKIEVYTIHHHNLDEYSNRIKKIAFDFYKNKIIHIVLDKKFEEMLKKECIINSPIEYLPHYLSKAELCTESKSESNYIVALSNSNDEEKICKLIEMDKTNKLENVGIKIVAKSKKISYKSKQLIILNGYILDEVYNHYFEKSKAVLILFPNSYNIRFSCTLIEALINYKIVIGYNIPFVDIYKQRYPNNIYSFNTYSELMSLFQKLSYMKFDMAEREKLLEALSDKNIEKGLNRIFKNYDF